jgi:hypothetical protein
MKGVAELLNRALGLWRLLHFPAICFHTIEKE